MSARSISVTVAVVALTAGAALPLPGVHAGDNIEVVTAGGTVISHKLWAPTAFPLQWHLSDQGVVNNDSVGAGTLPVSNADATAELSAAFQSWQDVPSSEITVAFAGETPVFDVGCDLVNIVTWSDTTAPFGAATIARGITTSYVGPDLVLTAANRNVACGPGTVLLPVATYPNGNTLRAGTILDMDMSWNALNFDYVTVPNATASVVDIRAVAAHEFGHMFGFSHTSLAFTASNPVTMFPTVSSTNVALQNNMRTLELDDEASSGRGYPGSGFFPGGVAPFTTGAVTGRVTQPGGAAATGVRVWAFSTADTTKPVYETFTATALDWDPSLQPGDYVLDGIVPGEYFLCIVAWENGVPTATSAQRARYNATTNNGVGNTGFPTECYDDAPSATAAPDFSSSDLIRKVTVAADQTTPSIDFVTGGQTADFVLVMDRSGSMTLPSGSPGKNKLEALQDAANAFIDFLDLTGGHRLGLVQFEETLVPLTPVFDLQPLTAGSVVNAHSAINGMAAGGWTNIIAGVEEGVDQLTTIASPNPRQILLVFSDGQHNRPVGSDLNDVHDPVVDNDVKLYSVGFGTDVDSAILSEIASDSGGLHVDEQDLDPLALGKHFLSIAASAADETTLIDPRYTLSPGKKATLAVPVTEEDLHFTFAVHWLTRGSSRVAVTLTSPTGCVVSTDAPAPGYGVRKGETHQVVRAPLPQVCRGVSDHDGIWTISATNRGRSSEEVQIIVFGRTPIALTAEHVFSKYGPVISSRLLRRGRPIVADQVWGEVLLPVLPTGDSEKQDGGRGGKTPPGIAPRSERLMRFALYDDGTHGDTVPRDGVFSALVPDVKDPGVYYVRLVAEQRDKALIHREQTTSFYFDGQLPNDTKAVKAKARDRY